MDNRWEILCFYFVFENKNKKRVWFLAIVMSNRQSLKFAVAGRVIYGGKVTVEQFLLFAWFHFLPRFVYLEVSSVLICPVCL